MNKPPPLLPYLNSMLVYFYIPFPRTVTNNNNDQCSWLSKIHTSQSSVHFPPNVLTGWTFDVSSAWSSTAELWIPSIHWSIDDSIGPLMIPLVNWWFHWSIDDSNDTLILPFTHRWFHCSFVDSYNPSRFHWYIDDSIDPLMQPFLQWWLHCSLASCLNTLEIREPQPDEEDGLLVPHYKV